MPGSARERTFTLGVPDARAFESNKPVDLDLLKTKLKAMVLRVEYRGDRSKDGAIPGVVTLELLSDDMDAILACTFFGGNVPMRVGFDVATPMIETNTPE